MVRRSDAKVFLTRGGSVGDGRFLRRREEKVPSSNQQQQQEGYGWNPAWFRRPISSRRSQFQRPRKVCVPAVSRKSLFRLGLKVVDRGDEAVAAAGKGLDKAGVVGGVSESFADAVYGGVEAVLEVSKGVGGPEFLLQLLAGDQFSGAEEQGFEDLEGLPGQANPDALLAQFGGVEIYLEDAEADDSRCLFWLTHRRHLRF